MGLEEVRTGVIEIDGEAVEVPENYAGARVKEAEWEV